MSVDCLCDFFTWEAPQGTRKHQSGECLVDDGFSLQRGGPSLLCSVPRRVCKGRRSPDQKPSPGSPSLCPRDPVGLLLR